MGKLHTPRDELPVLFALLANVAPFPNSDQVSPVPTSVRAQSIKTITLSLLERRTTTASLRARRPRSLVRLLGPRPSPASGHGASRLHRLHNLQSEPALPVKRRQNTCNKKLETCSQSFAHLRPLLPEYSDRLLVDILVTK